jgi:hypothetical protein
MTHGELRQYNRKIGLELGFNPHGEPRFKWQHSESMWRPMPTGEYEYKVVSQATGLLGAVPQTRMRKVNPLLHDQWVVCVWEAPIPQAEWMRQFGAATPWPAHGDYHPTGVVLDPGVEPTVTLNDTFIGEMKRQMRKTYADHLVDAETSIAAGEHKVDTHLEDFCADAMPAFMNDPGKKAHVSFPTPGASESPSLL